MVNEMTILIYYMEEVNGKIALVEYGRFSNGKVTGKVSIDDISEDEVKRTFNSGYWRTSETKEL